MEEKRRLMEERVGGEELVVFVRKVQGAVGS